MDNALSNEYIGNAIDQLVACLGVKENIDSTKLEKMYSNEEVDQGVKYIASQLGLPIKIHLVYGEQHIQTKGVARTDEDGRGMEGVIAQVSIPESLPVYGSNELKHYSIKIFLGKNYQQQRPTLFTIIAHELSHVLLYCIRSQYKDNEYYTDLVAPILGLCEVVEKGRKVVKKVVTCDEIKTYTTTYGYLTDKQLEFAKKKISNILDLRRDTKVKYFSDLSELERLCGITKHKLKEFEKILNKLDKYPKAKIAVNESNRLMILHQSTYLDGIIFLIKECEKYIYETSTHITKIIHYNNKNISALESFRGKTIKLAGGLIAKSATLDGDIILMKKSMRIIGRIV